MRMLVLGWKPGFDSVMSSLPCNPVVVAEITHLAKYPELASGRYDVVEVGNFCDVVQVLSALARRGPKYASFDCVHTDQEQAVVPAAVLGCHFGDLRITVDAAIAARDKFVQKQRLANAGIPVADYLVFEQGAVPQEVQLEQLSWPRILKPVSGGGTRDTSRVNGPADTLAAWHGYRPNPGAEPAMLLESLVEGTELHLDGVMIDGELHFLSVSRYLDNLLSVRSGTVPASLTLDSRDHPVLYQQARPFAAAALNALGLLTTVFHLEAFLTTAGLVFSECGARAGGAFVADAVLDKYGIDLRLCGASLAMGHHPDLAAAPRSEAVGFTLLACPPGTITRLPSREEIMAMEGIVKVNLNVSVGDRKPDEQSDTAQRSAIALLRAPDESALELRIGSAQHSFSHAVHAVPAL
ncbi:ATP-grasp domain-containing protein [Nocardia sp. NPDC004722]